jgi:uncharacterized membrane protein
VTGIDQLLFVLTLLAALGCGLVAGVFLAFSSFVMKALGRLPAPGGIAAMQSINITVINPVFMAVFLGTAALSVVVLFTSLLRWPDSGGGYLVAGSVLYVAGTFLVTIMCNVPRNHALAVVDPASAEGARVWSAYLPGWTGWNHVRTAAALAAAAAFSIALA